MHFIDFVGYFLRGLESRGQRLLDPNAKCLVPLSQQKPKIKQIIKSGIMSPILLHVFDIRKRDFKFRSFLLPPLWIVVIVVQLNF